MKASLLPIGVVRTFAVSALAIGACSLETTDSTNGPEGAGGKADGVNDAEICGQTVALNAASGSAKRCVDADTGRFVPSECCADLCAGAGWRDQANGSACAWLEAPGLPGATQGQFAPAMCCNLNDDLACGRAESSGGGCADPESGRGMQDVCCEPTPNECHPAVRSSITGCAFDQVDSFSDDPESFMPNLLELFDLCTSEGELMAQEIDQRCSFQPDLPFCELPFEQVDTQFIEPCRTQLRDEFDCTFGLEFHEVFQQFHLSIVSDRDMELADAEAADAITQAQILEATKRGAIDETTSLAEAFDFFDDSFINVIEIFDASSGRSYTAYEFGAGDNGFGAIFEAGTTNVVTDINDSFLENPDGSFTVGCGVSIGPAGRRCGGERTCADGLRCQGVIDHPVHGALGRCVDPNLGAATAGEECTELRACGEGSYCAGLSVDFGMCTPGWMFGSAENEDTTEAADGGQAQTDIFVYGAATVPVDLELSMGVFHDTDISQLLVTLVGPLRDEGTIATVFDGATANVAPGTTFQRIRMPAPHPGDEAINGQWTLQIEDAAGNGGGGVFEWSLAYSSRFD